MDKDNEFKYVDPLEWREQIDSRADRNTQTSVMTPNPTPPAPSDTELPAGISPVVPPAQPAGDPDEDKSRQIGKYLKLAGQVLAGVTALSTGVMFGSGSVSPFVMAIILLPLLAALAGMYIYKIYLDRRVLRRVPSGYEGGDEANANALDEHMTKVRANDKRYKKHLMWSAIAIPPLFIAALMSGPAGIGFAGWVIVLILIYIPGTTVVWAFSILGVDKTIERLGGRVPASHKVVKIAAVCVIILAILYLFVLPRLLSNN